MIEDSIENNTHLPLLQFATPKVMAASEIYIPEGKIFKKIFKRFYLMYWMVTTIINDKFSRTYFIRDSS